MKKIILVTIILLQPLLLCECASPAKKDEGKHTALDLVAEYNLLPNGDLDTDYSVEKENVIQVTSAYRMFGLSIDSETGALGGANSRTIGGQEYYLPDTLQLRAIFSDQLFSVDHGFTKLNAEESVAMGEDNFVIALSDFREEDCKVFAIRFKGTVFESAWLYEFIDNPDSRGRILRIRAFALGKNEGDINALIATDFDREGVDERLFPLAGYIFGTRCFDVGERGYYLTTSLSDIDADDVYYMTYETHSSICNSEYTDGSISPAVADSSQYISVRPFIKKELKYW